MPTAQVVDVASQPVVGNKSRSKTYHLSNCPTLKHMRPENRVNFETGKAAVAAGFRACETCITHDGKPAKKPLNPGAASITE